MPKYNDLTSSGPFTAAHLQISDLVGRLKHDYQLEAIFDDVLYGEGVALSPGAQLMLIIPIIEADALQRARLDDDTPDAMLTLDTEVIRRSLRQIVAEAASNPADSDQFPDELTVEDEYGREWPMRSTLSLIKSFAARFCNIPPFCGERGRQP